MCRYTLYRDIPWNMDLTAAESVPEASVGLTEERHYQLNQQKSLKKKFNACDRDTVSVEHTGGGLMFRFNTGFYEVFKYTAEQFYSTGEMLDHSFMTQVHDKKL